MRSILDADTQTEPSDWGRRADALSKVHTREHTYLLLADSSAPFALLRPSVEGDRYTNIIHGLLRSTSNVWHHTLGPNFMVARQLGVKTDWLSCYHGMFYCYRISMISVSLIKNLIL